MPQDIRVKRIYDSPSAGDGTRILVDRLWPRGVSKSQAALTFWLKDVAPTTELRKWYNHDPAREDEFRRRYCAELDANAAAVERLRQFLDPGPLTLLYGSRDAERNHAQVLAEYLQDPARARRPHKRTGGEPKQA